VCCTPATLNISVHTFFTWERKADVMMSAPQPDHRGGPLTPKRLPIVTMLAVMTCMTAVLASPAGASAYSLTGAGSTLIAPLEAYWGQNFEQRYGDKVTYSAVGSGAGIAQITARTVDFGASDAPLTPSQAAACNNCIQIPWALTAVGISYNVPGISRLRLTGPVLAAIYKGSITNWNSPVIAKLNKGLKLPNLKITVAFRSDGSGDTYAFTDYLSRISSAWKSQVGNATSVSFPTGVGGKGNAGVTAIVSSTSGAIGYISASYLIAHGLQAAAMQNAAGKYEYPNLKNIENAASSVTHVPANNEMHIVNPPKKYKTAYPLSTFTYAIIPRAAPQKGGLASWVYYAMTLGQSYGAALDFAPIPKVVLKAGVKSVRELQQG
jgi:phosphate transport system substrate-binding protein